MSICLFTLDVPIFNSDHHLLSLPLKIDIVFYFAIAFYVYFYVYKNKISLISICIVIHFFYQKYLNLGNGISDGVVLYSDAKPLEVKTSPLYFFYYL